MSILKDSLVYLAAVCVLSMGRWACPATVPQRSRKRPRRSRKRSDRPRWP